MKKSGPFFGGVPTEIDIRGLREAFPAASLTPGRVIQYSAFEGVLRVPHTSHRYHTVMHRWRKIMEREAGILFDAPGDKTLVVQDDSGKVDTSCRKLRSSVRAGRRSIVIAGLVDLSGLSVEEKARHADTVQRAGAVIAAAQLKRPPDLPKLGS